MITYLKFFIRPPDIIAGWAKNYILIRNILNFNVTYEEMKNQFQNENGKSIFFPIRTGKRKMDLTIECDSEDLKVLKKLFFQTEIKFAYSENGTETEEISFFKKSDIQINTIDRKKVDYGNSCIYYQDGDDSKPTPFHFFYGCELMPEYEGRGMYEFSVSLEEV